VENLLNMLRRLLGKDVSLESRSASNPLWIQADTSMIEQVVTNLCLNARDAMGPTGGSLTIDTRLVELDAGVLRVNPDACPGLFVCLSVTDTGCGMDVDTMNHLFEPFFTTKEVGKGTGLGLSTVYGITKHHNGWVEVDSQLGKGSTFRIYLPTLAKAPLFKDDPILFLPPRGKETILIVEDDSTVRNMVALGLQKCGYHVLEAVSGPEAIKVWSRHAGEIDLLFADMKMPGGLTGMDLFERFKRVKTSLKGVISSGYSEEIVKSQGLIDSGVSFLPKPYDVQTLAGTVRSCLDEVCTTRIHEPM
jgi:CheY-like chemotaxis protein